jgi:myosin heavy subunit
MDNLMEEMAEALLKMGGDNSQPIPEGVEPTELHFIRCIKPRPKPLNKTDRPGLFVYTMTLQQITYMGVLESVELKQKNFPFRKKFIEFYQEYELLSPRFSTIRFY